MIVGASYAGELLGTRSSCFLDAVPSEISLKLFLRVPPLPSTLPSSFTRSSSACLACFSTWMTMMMVGWILLYLYHIHVTRAIVPPHLHTRQARMLQKF